MFVLCFLDSSDTHWNERHDSVLTFVELYQSIFLTLEQMSQWIQDRDAASEATGLLAATSRHKFVVALQCLNHVLGLTKTVSVALQAKNLKLLKCLEQINTVLQVLKSWRDGYGSGSFDNYQDAT